MGSLLIVRFYDEFETITFDDGGKSARDKFFTTAGIPFGTLEFDFSRIIATTQAPIPKNTMITPGATNSRRIIASPAMIQSILVSSSIGIIG